MTGWVNRRFHYFWRKKPKLLKSPFIPLYVIKRVIFSKIFTITWICLTTFGNSAAKDYMVSGTVTDMTGLVVPNAKVSMFSGSIEYSAVSGANGNYSMRISGIYSEVSDMLELGMPHPNPFTYAVNIPFTINSSGDVRFSVYSFTGQKIKEVLYQDVTAGSYRIIWDGCNDNGAPVRQGIYIYAITFKGNTWSSKIIKVAGFSSFSSATTLETCNVTASHTSGYYRHACRPGNYKGHLFRILPCKDHRYCYKEWHGNWLHNCKDQGNSIQDSGW